MTGLYQVIVSNLGTVYDGDDEAEANKAYKDYVHQSSEVIGRPAGENVTLMYKGEPYREYMGLRGIE